MPLFEETLTNSWGRRANCSATPGGPFPGAGHHRSRYGETKGDKMTLKSLMVERK
jgi:hypothetical protein